MTPDPNNGPIGYFALGAALLLYPAVASDFFLTQIGGYSLIYGMLALSLMILAGYGGMVSLAQITVAGTAGYVIAIFGENTTGVLGFGWVWWIVTPLAIAIAAITSALIGCIAVRTEGIYTIMITRHRNRHLLFRPTECRTVQRPFRVCRPECAGVLGGQLA